MKTNVRKFWVCIIVIAMMAQILVFAPVSVADSWTAVNDSAASVSLVGTGWAVHNTWHETWHAGDYALFTFTGTGIRWYPYTESFQGTADVYVDNVFKRTVDFKSFPDGVNLVYEQTGLSSGSHTFKIVEKNTGVINAREFDYLSGGTPTPTPTPTVTVTPTATPTPPPGGSITYYQICNRWYGTSNGWLYDGGTHVYYSTLASNDTYLWSLEDYNGYKRIKNKSTGKYMNIQNGETNLVCSSIAATNTTSHWTLAALTGQYRSLQCRSNNKYLSNEGQLGYVTCDATNVPNGDNWASEQWTLVYVSGPTPPPVYNANTVYVSSPAYCANISGSTTISIVAPNLTSATVKCWQSGGTYGSDSTVGTVTLDGSGKGSIVFPANSYPHGPLNIKITGTNGSVTNVCSLQVYNTGGTVWNQGIPSATPAAAAGMSLTFSDDFNTMPSISSTGAGATYAAHKPGGGDFSSIPFADPTGPGNPFSQVDSYLRIRTSATLNTAGLISALKMDGTGVTATAPCYFECRFIAQNAIGTWPAFWTMTRGVYLGLDKPADELDVIEAYGIEDPNHGNYKGYWIASHVWNQGAGPFPGFYGNINQTTLGGTGNWNQTFHTYGVKITLTDTIYYMDNIQVASHATTPLSKTDPIFFLINNATGGGWPVDLSRYNGLADMYVDWVRVYK